MSKAIHTSILKPSDRSMLEGATAVEERFLTVCKRYLKKWGVELQIPNHLKQDFIHWRELVVRYNQGDFRHTDAELRSLKEIAQWTVDINCELCGAQYTNIAWRS